MAIVQNLYTGDGTTVLYSLSFPYIDQVDVKVEVNNVLVTNYVFSTASSIQFTSAPANGATIKIYRLTDTDSLEATIFPGSAIKAQDLNNNFIQALYAVQEILARYLSILGGTMQAILNMGGYKITNLAGPTAGTDAANKTYVDANDALKVAKAGDSMTGDLAMGNNRVTGLTSPALSGDAATKGYVDAADALKVNKAGDTMSGPLAMGANKVTGVSDPTQPQDASTKAYTDAADALKVNKAGDTMSGALNMGTNKITNLGTPTNADDAVTKGYADAIVAAGVGDGDKGDIIVGGAGTSWTIDTGVVTNNKIGSGAVTSDKIANGTIVNDDISASAAIAGSKIQAGTTSDQGAVQLTDSTSSTSTTTAATPNSVKQAYDLANAALPKAGGTLTGNVDNTATGYFDLPVGTTAERPVSPNSGYVRFNTDLGQYEGYNGSVWSSIGGGATGGGSDQVFLENGNTVTTNYTLTAGKNAVSAGPITINSGVTVTVPSGLAWVIV